MKERSKALLTVACALLLMVATVFGTFAYLTSTTETVTNTFTVGNVAISLAETTGDTYKIIPGHDIAKDPKITVTENSEDSWVFVEVTEKNWTRGMEDNVTYTIADGWTAGDGTNIPANVYYRQYSTTAVDTIFHVLAHDQLKVSGELTSAEAAEIAAASSAPTLDFKAYAIQADGFTTATAAWAEVSK